MLFVTYLVKVSALQQRRLPIVENHPHLIDSCLEIRVVERHRLPHLPTREQVAWQLVILWEDHLVAHDAKNERWMDFQMGVGLFPQ